MKLLDYSGLQRFLNKIKTLLDSKSNTGHTHTVSDVSGLSTVATSGDYGDLSNTPTIPTVNNAKLTIQKNGTTVETFTANASSNVTANITVPTAVSELTNDSGYLTSASSLDSSKLTGTIDIARLPKGALERLVTVANQAARFALTVNDVQLGDTVKQLDTGVMYIVTDETKLNSADGYTEYTAGSATSVPWSGVTGKPSSFTPSSHSHGNIANGGTLGTASRALITDGNKKITTSSVTSTELGYVSGVTSAIQTQLNGKSNTGHTHVTSEVTDLLNSQHTWSAQQSYSADLNLNYTSTDVDDILDTVAGSYAAEDFLAQNNVWTGDNTYSKAVGFTKVNDITLYTQNSRAGLGETNLSGDTYTQISFEDKNGDNFGYLRQTYYTDGDNRISIYVRNKFTSGAPSTSGTADYAYFGLRLNADKSKEGVLRGTFRPYDNNAYDLGSSLYQWKSVYAKNYYYNGTQWGLDQANVWTNIQRMTSNPAVWYLRNNTVTLGSAPSSNRYIGMFFEDINGADLGYASFQANKNGYNSIMFSLRNSDGTNAYTGALRYRASTTGAYCFFPENSECDLGISTNQWKSVYAQSYYYNGTAWGLDQNNTWTGANNFSILSLFSNSVTYNQAPSSNVELPSIRIFGGGKYCGAFDYVWSSTGENVIRLSLASYRSDGSFGYWACNFGVPRDFSNGGNFGTPAFYPNNNKGYNLGTSNNQWANIYGTTIYEGGTALSSKYLTVSAITGGASTSAGNITPVKGTIISGFADSSSVTYSTTFGGVLTSTSALYYATCIYNTSNSTMAFSKGPAVGGTGTWKLMGGGSSNPGTSTKLLFGLWVKIA